MCRSRGWWRKRTKTPTERRRRPERRQCAAAALLLVLCAACSGGAERAVLDHFFAASRLRDLTALEKVSTVIFEPRQDGTVLDYDVVLIRSTGPDTEEVLINATVHMPSGNTQHKPLLVTLKRVNDRLRVAAVRVSTESASP